MQITVISGTNRQGSNTLKVATHVAAQYQAIEGVQVTLVDLQELPESVLSPTAYANKPAALDPLVAPVLAADGLVVVTPEYNGGFPGVLKLFIDMLPFPEAFDGRKVCFVGLAAGRWGALRPVEQLQQVFGYRNAVQFPERVLLPSVNTSIDDAGAPTDAFVQGLLASQVSGFVDFIRKLS
ncbi:MAG: NADPH-dependent FMN reductase [Myxococcota bacterium]